MTTTGLPFDDIRTLARNLPGLDEAAGAQAREVLAGQGLGRIEDVAAWFAASTGRPSMRVAKPVVALFAATHTVSRHLGSADPVREAQARVEEIAAGAAPVSQLCAANDLGLNVFDLALELPVGDVTETAALDERAAAATVAFGMEAVAVGADLLCLGAVGKAADFSAMAVLSALAGDKAEAWGVAAPEKRQLLAKALDLHQRHLGDPLEVLRRLGAREIAALCGAILAARTQTVAVVLDGLAATAAAAVLHALNPEALAHCLLAGAESEMQREIAGRMGLDPLLDLQVRGQGGVSAALAAVLVRSAAELSAAMAQVRARG